MMYRVCIELRCVIVSLFFRARKHEIRRGQMLSFCCRLFILFVGMLSSRVYVSAAEIDLNTATVKELQTVKGIGPAKARAIITWRKRHGLFQNIDDLNQVPGFGAKLIKQLKPQLTVGFVGISPPVFSIERRQGK